jgi:hypothetical protein
MAPYAGGWLLTADRPDNPLHLAAGFGMTAADVSRDGRWVCFGRHASHMEVFDGRTGRQVWEDAHDHGGWGGRFTPDGRWLVGCFRAFRVGDWETSVVLDPSRTGSLYDVSPDSRLALIGMHEGYARLVEIATGRELVRIEPPDLSLGVMTFTPDGARLLEPCGSGLRVWDLRRIRRRLAEFGLDWDGPAYPPEPEGPSDLPAPLQLTAHGSPLGPFLWFEGVLEGEKLKLVGKSSAYPLRPQDMKPFKDGLWSGDAHLLGQPPKAGEWADLELPVAADGKYAVIVYLTKAHDYGVIQFALDGKPLGKPFDGFEPDKVVASGPVELGTVELKEGAAVLRVEVTGTNEKSVGLRYMWGLDCVVLKPAN